MNIHQAFARCRKASVATVFALVLPVLLGFAALVAEYGSILVTEANNQRVADLASYAGALAYNSVSTEKEAATLAAANRIASLNGVSTSYLTVTYPTSIKTSGAVSVRASITSPYTLLVARALNTTTSVPVTTDAYTEISGGASSCILALSPSGTGVTLTGGTALTASTCAVNSNNKVSATCGTTITASAVTWGTSLVEGCSNITAPTKVLQTTTDPFIGNAGIATMNSRVATVEAMAAPAAPTVSAVPAGTVSLNNTTLGYKSELSVSLANGCTATQTSGYSNIWTITCPPGGTYNFLNIDNGNSATYTLFPTGNSSTTYNISGTVTMAGSMTTNWGTGNYNFGGTVNLGGIHNFPSGTYNFGSALRLTNSGTITFGSGTYNLAGGLYTSGSTVVTFGSGTFNIGRYAVTCASSNQYSICQDGTTLTFQGPSTFVLSSGLYVGGGSTMRLGYDASNTNLTGNSYSLGPSTTGSNAIYVGGGSKLYMADATDTGKLFQADGNFNGGGGGSCTMLPAAAQHDIDGYVLMTGAVIFGAGVYTVDGYIALGASGGGGGTCNGNSVSFNADGVNIMISGSITPTSGNCSAKAFCVGAGYNNIVIKAPTTGSLADLAVIGPQNSAYTGGATMTEGGTGAIINGAFYFPNGTVTLSGGASAADAGGCFQVVGTSISLTGGTSLASSCVGGSGSVSAKLVR